MAAPGWGYSEIASLAGNLPSRRGPPFTQRLLRNRKQRDSIPVIATGRGFSDRALTPAPAAGI
jgi:hypothetical protein